MRRVLVLTDVKYRNPYQMRHTYASTLLSKGENPWWRVTQMWHVDVEMIFKHYGKCGYRKMLTSMSII